MKILIIGASGMLAKPVIRELGDRGYKLRLFSRNVTKAMFSKNYEIINGDVFHPEDVQKALKGCSAIHINLSLQDEARAVQNIVKLALEENIQLISTISGNSVCEENRWFPMIDNKYRAEQTIIHSGIPYLIFRAGWFFESLDLMVRNGKATMIGKQERPGHWIAARDYASQVGKAFSDPSTWNRIYYILGKEAYTMRNLLTQYCKLKYPEIRKVSTVPVSMLKFIGLLSFNKELRNVASMFGYFEKTTELGDPFETYSLLGKPETDFIQWINLKN
ncbi:MAG: NAD(P)H-binding protein [Bacteroidales bacterium]|nr:NAD(P)H-binding protein [Bacteroidales bacterium]